MSSVKHLSTGELIARMERAHEDQNLDDETAELEARLFRKGQSFRWDGGRIVVEDRLVVI